MDERHTAHGALFYSTLYVNGILLAVGAMTGRWIFLLLILLTLGLTAYMMYIASNNTQHLREMGKWAEEMVAKAIQRIKGLYSNGP